jgi:hypothetical protein
VAKTRTMVAPARAKVAHFRDAACELAARMSSPGGKSTSFSSKFRLLHQEQGCLGFEGSASTRGSVVGCSKNSKRLRDGSLGAIEPTLGNFCDLGVSHLDGCTPSLPRLVFALVGQVHGIGCCGHAFLRGIRHDCPGWIAFGASRTVGHSDEPAMSGRAPRLPSRHARLPTGPAPRRRGRVGGNWYAGELRGWWDRGGRRLMNVQWREGVGMNRLETVPAERVCRA